MEEKNAKMGKMGSLTSRKVREGDKVLHHSTRLKGLREVGKYYPYWLVVD